MHNPSSLPPSLDPHSRLGSRATEVPGTVTAACLVSPELIYDKIADEVLGAPESLLQVKSSRRPVVVELPLPPRQHGGHSTRSHSPRGLLGLRGAPSQS